MKFCLLAVCERDPGGFFKVLVHVYRTNQMRLVPGYHVSCCEGFAEHPIPNVPATHPLHVCPEGVEVVLRVRVPLIEGDF